MECAVFSLCSTDNNWIIRERSPSDWSVRFYNLQTKFLGNYYQQKQNLLRNRHFVAAGSKRYEQFAGPRADADLEM